MFSKFIFQSFIPTKVITCESIIKNENNWEQLLGTTGLGPLNTDSSYVNDGK